MRPVRPDNQEVSIQQPGGSLVVSEGGAIAANRYDYLVEQGRLYHVSWVWSSVVDGSNQYVLVRCAEEADCHIVMDFTLGGDWSIGLHEAPTVNTLGTELSAHPMNRTVLNPAATHFFHTSTSPSADGTRIISLRAGTLRLDAGQVCIGHWVLRQGTDYLVTLTNNSGATAAAGIVATFYE